MASSKVMSSTSPANPDLPRHSSTTTNPSTPRTKTKTKIKTNPPPPSSSTAAATSSLAQNSSALLPHQQQEHSQIQPHHLHHSDQSFGSMNMEEILKNIYSEPDSLSSAVDGGDLPAVDGGGAGRSDAAGVAGGKTVDDVWKDIVTGGGGGGGGRSDQPRMTLEDYLTKAGAVTEDDVRAPAVSPPAPLPVPAAAGGGAGGYGVEAMMNAAAVHFPPVVHMQNEQGAFGMESQLGFGNGMMAAAAAGPIRGAGGGGSGRGKRRAPPVEEVALDKATQQKQRRMIKNRESAARSRERKQAYTVELESLVTHLEEENARLLREEAEQNRKRFKQLMENLIPVVEKQRPPRVLRRVQSMSW